MTTAEERRWQRNARKAEHFLVSVLLDSEQPLTHRMKAAELCLDRYYGKPTTNARNAEVGLTGISIDWGGHEDYGG